MHLTESDRKEKWEELKHLLIWVNHPLPDFVLLEIVIVFLYKLVELEFSVLMLKAFLSNRGISLRSCLKLVSEVNFPSP